MNRKEFIKSCGLVCLGGAALTALLQDCAGLNYMAGSSRKGNQLVVKKSEFEKTGKQKNQKRKFIVVKPEHLDYPICIYRLGDTVFSAVLMECTHKGCELQPHGDYLICPCHGSEFSKTGAVQNPPAEKDLRSFTITCDEETIYLQL